MNESTRNFVTLTKDVRQTKLGECLLLHLGISGHSVCTVNTLPVKYKAVSLLILYVFVCVIVKHVRFQSFASVYWRFSLL